MELGKIIGTNIQNLRKEKNMTLKELAGDRITAAQISHIERDKSHTSRELLEYLASQLDVSVDYLLETKEMQSKKLTDNLILQGEILIKCNDLEKAEDQLNEAIKICDEYKVLDNYATCNFLLADINFKKGKYSESVMGYEKALYYFIKNNDKDKLYKCYLNIGKIYMIEEFYKGAILQFEFSEGILNEIQVEDVDIYKDLYSKMAYCYIKLDNNEKSLDYINKMDEIDIKNNLEEELDVLILKANNLEAEVKGNGKTIVSMDTYPGATVKEGTTITITAKDSGQVEKQVIMPDLKGNTEEFATSILNNLGLVYEFEGEGNVYSQSVTAGNKVVKGTKVTITLKKEFEY